MEYKEKEKIVNNYPQLLNKFKYRINSINSNTSYFKNKNLLIYQSKFFFIKLFILIFMNRFSILFEFNTRNILFKLSEVTLKTKEIGTIQILSDEFFKKYNQCDVYKNGNIQTQTKNKYSFTHQESGINTVRIIWKTKIDTTGSMFSDCNKIYEIDLSKFDTTYVTAMNNMFYNCSSLKSINFYNINTSKVVVMASMFSYCTSLVSLDLSNFITSNVNFFPGMFSSCLNLEFVNFKLLNSSICLFDDAMFDSTAKKLIVCSKNDDKLISSYLSEKKFVKCNNSNPNSINRCYSEEKSFS